MERLLTKPQYLEEAFFINNWRKGESRGTLECWAYVIKEVTARMPGGGGQIPVTALSHHVELGSNP
jgi:hypothetical protein